MRKVLWFAFFSSFIFLACKPPERTSSLKINVGPKPAYILPTSMLSCVQMAAGSVTGGSVGAPSFQFTKFDFTYEGTNTARIDYIQLEFRHAALASGKYQCTISGDELTVVLGLTTLPTNIPTSAQCGIRCGAVTFVTGTTSAYIPGVMKVIGSEYDAEGNGTPFVTEAQVYIQKNDF